MRRRHSNERRPSPPRRSPESGLSARLVAEVPAAAPALLPQGEREAKLDWRRSNLNDCDGEGGVAGLDGARASTTNPDGRFVYVAGAAEDAVAVFAREMATGTLAFVEVQRNGVAGVSGLDEPWEFAPSPDGGHLYVAARDGNAVVAFARGPSTGRPVSTVSPAATDSRSPPTARTSTRPERTMMPSRSSRATP